MTGTLLLDPPAPVPHTRVRFDLGGHRARLRRPAPLRHRRAGARPRGARRVLRRPARRRAARARLHRRPPASADARVARPDQGVPARPEARRRRRQHLRRRGAVPRPHPSRCGSANRLSRAQAAALRDAVVAALQAGIAAKGATIDDFRDPDGVERRLPGPVPRAPARGRAVPALRQADPQAARRRPRDLRVRALPARAGGEARGRLGRALGEARQPAGAVGLHELLVAADRLAVDDDLGERHHAGQRATSSARPVRVLGQVDLVVGDAALLRAAPWRRGSSRRVRWCRR